MTPAEEVQDLLRFLTKEARVPLATAMPKIHELRKANLNSADAISKTSLPNVQRHFNDEKVAKQVFNAAKRITKRASNGETASPLAKRARSPAVHGQLNNDVQALEDSLNLPSSDASEAELKATILQTNRAPLVLAFAVTLLKYTMPEQPLSSRLSLAQGNVSLNSKSKAQAIGLDSSKSAEDEGWGKGQPQVKVLGRPIPVMRRSGYQVSRDQTNNDGEPSTKKVKVEQNQGSEDDLGNTTFVEEIPEEALWGLDLEAIRKSNGPLIQKTNHPSSINGLPVYSPHSARSYLLRSFSIVDRPNNSPSSDNFASSNDSNQSTIKAEPTTSSPSDSKSNPTLSISKPTPSPMPKKSQKPKTLAEQTAEKHRALALLLQALDLLMKSWATLVTADELDRKAWNWYMSVRPEIASGQKGWGQKGEVKLEKILGLRRKL